MPHFVQCGGSAMPCHGEAFRRNGVVIWRAVFKVENWLDQRALDRLPKRRRGGETMSQAEARANQGR